MPIWLELFVLLWVTFMVGLALGWVIWGRNSETVGSTDND